MKNRRAVCRKLRHLILTDNERFYHVLQRFFFNFPRFNAFDVLNLFLRRFYIDLLHNEPRQ